MRNADKIRSMSDEELAEFILQANSDGCTISCKECGFNDGENCLLDSGVNYMTILEWLQKEAEE